MRAGYPNGAKGFKASAALTELDIPFSAFTTGTVVSVAFIPQASSRKAALTTLYRQILLLSPRIELEATQSDEHMKNAKIGKDIFTATSTEVADEVQVPAGVPPGMEQLREPTPVTNTTLLYAKLEEMLKSPVEKVI